MKERTKKMMLMVSSVFIIIIGFGLSYLTDSYEPTSDAILAMNSSEEVEVESHENSKAFLPKEDFGKAGLVFYQGGKVEAEAYAPLMKGLAEEGDSFLHSRDAL